MSWVDPKVTWAAGQEPLHTDFKRIEDNEVVLAGRLDSAEAGIAEAVPDTRTVNAKGLSTNITITPDDLDDTSTTHLFVIAADKTNWNGKIANVVEDTTPQLGGELDCQGHTVGFTETDNGNSGTNKAIDWRLSNHQKVTMTGNCTFTFTAPTKPAALTLLITNDATAGRTITLPTIKWVGGITPVWTKLANAIDFLQLYWNGTFYIGQAALKCS